MKRAFLVGFWLVALFLPADLAQAQQRPLTNDRPLILWAPPPVIGYYSLDSSLVDESSPLIASADWPAFTDSLVASLTACGHFRRPLKAWSLRTVAAPVFGVRTKLNPAGDQPFVGFSFSYSHRIYVVQSRARSRSLLRHELLHALMADNGLDPRHGTPLANALFPICAPDLSE